MSQFERFSDAAKAVVARAQKEAADAGQNYVGTEHLALALCRDEEGIAGRALADMGVTYEALKAQVGHILGRTGRPAVTRIAPTSRVKRVVELAFQEATIAGDDFVGAEHLLQALLIEAEGAGARALDQLGVTLGKTRRSVRAALDDHLAQQGSVPTDSVGTSSSLSIALMGAGQLAKEEGVTDIRADHLILAMAMSQLSDLHGVLRKLGLTPEMVTTRLTLPEEVRQLGLAALRVRGEQAPALFAGGVEADRAVEEVVRRTREHSEAVSHWLEGGNAH